MNEGDGFVPVAFVWLASFIFVGSLRSVGLASHVLGVALSFSRLLAVSYSSSSFGVPHDMSVARSHSRRRFAAASRSLFRSREVPLHGASRDSVANFTPCHPSPRDHVLINPWVG